LQGVVALQAQDEADEEARHADDGQRVVAQEVHLVAHQREAAQRGARQLQQAQEQARAAADVPELGAGGQAQAGQG